MAGFPCHFALGVGGGAEGEESVVGGGETLEDGVEGEGVGLSRHGMLCGVGVACAVDPLPLPEPVVHLLALELDASGPLSQRDVECGAHLCGVDAEVEVIAGMLEERTHASVETVGVARLAEADLVEEVLALDVVEFLFAVQLCRGGPAQAEPRGESPVVGGMPVEGESPQERAVAVALGTVKIDIQEECLVEAAERDGVALGDKAVDVASPDGS